MLGLGLLGRGIGDAVYMAKYCDELIITDKKTEVELQASIDSVKAKLSDANFAKIKFIFGEHRLEDFRGRDFIIKSAGVPLDNIYVAEAVKNNVPVYMSAALALMLIKLGIDGSSIRTIGITGTRGKSTVTAAIYSTLKEIMPNIGVHLAGNVRGVANLPVLEKVHTGDVLVMELDSWQLQGFGTLKISPHVSVFTNFLDDHLNYYHNDRQLYFNDKANIFKYQSTKDFLIASSQSAIQIEKFNPKLTVESNYTLNNNAHIDIKSDLIVADYNQNIIIVNNNLIGSHNKVNILLAYYACLSLGLAGDQISNALSKFTGVEGRLEYMGNILDSRVSVYNDNNATNPDAVIAALKAVYEHWSLKPVLIAGGTDKGLDLEELASIIISHAAKVVLIAGTGTDKLMPLIHNKVDYAVYDTILECVDAAVKFSDGMSSGVILFSPGFASFSNYFNNEYERNDEFVKCIQALRC